MTVKELVEWIGQRHPDVKADTVRRNLYRLIDDGVVESRNTGPFNAAVFEAL